MRKLLIGLTLLTLILLALNLFNTSAFAINEQEAKKYLDKDVFVVIAHTTSVGLYGRIIDIVEVKGETCIILDTYYMSGRQLMFLQIENISYIRERKGYE